MSKNIDDVIVETTLNLLSARESKQSPSPHVSADEVFAYLPGEHLRKCNKAYVEMILDDEFSKRYNGKQVVYFLKVK